MSRTLYDTDYRGWALEQARNVRTGGGEIDREHIAEELESLGRSEEEQLYNRLAVLLAHILKGEHQPDRRSRSCSATIREQQKRLVRLMDRNPSLKAIVGATIPDAYGTAVAFAAAETLMVEDEFPNVCPYSWEELLEYKAE